MKTQPNEPQARMREAVKVPARKVGEGRISRSRIRAIIPMVLLPLLGSCYKSLDICYSVSSPDERVLEIRRIFNSGTNAPVPGAILSDFSYNQIEFFEDGAARTGGGPGAEVISQREIRCTTPCKFGGQQGSYGFLVTAPGFQPKRVELAADWLNEQTLDSDCQFELSGATVVEIALEPQG